MNEEETQQDFNEEELITSWPIPEFDRHERKKSWYIIAIAALLALMIYAIYTANFLFAVILIFLLIIFYLDDRQGAKEISFKITTDGITIGEKSYFYKEIKNFYVIYEPPEVKNVYFVFKNIAKPRIRIPLFDQNPVIIREVLLKHLEEDLEKEYEPVSDRIGRFLKL
jgi:hypothetical protein